MKLRTFLFSLILTSIISLPGYSQKGKSLTNDDFNSSKSSNNSTTSNSSPSSTLNFDSEDIRSNTVHFTKEQRLEAGEKLLKKIEKWKLVGKLTGTGIDRKPMLLELFKSVDKEESSYNIALKITGNGFASNKTASLVYLMNPKTLGEYIEIFNNLTVDGKGKDNFLIRTDTNGMESCPAYTYQEVGKPKGITIGVRFPFDNFDNPLIKSGFPRVEFSIESLDSYFELTDLPAIKKFIASALK